MEPPSSPTFSSTFSARRRNYMLSSHRKDGLIAYIKEMLNHSFVLGRPEGYRVTIKEIEDLFDEHYKNPKHSTLKHIVPSMGPTFTPLRLTKAFDMYNKKYAVTSRRFVSPSFNEVRHMLNLAQIMGIGNRLKLISFDGDQTLYADGGNFDRDGELASGMLNLLRGGVYVAVVTAAGYGLDGPKYEVRLEGLLKAIEEAGLDAETAGHLLVLGGSCNYLLRCVLKQGTDKEGLRARLEAVPADEWQNDSIDGPKPLHWPREQTERLMEMAECSFRDSVRDLKLRARIIRKERSVGIIPGGASSVARVAEGHGSKKLKREALDEVVMSAMDRIRCANPKFTIPYWSFNGGRDAWVDAGDKSVGVAALQAWLGIAKDATMHVGDQFLNTGNDVRARNVAPCLWIISPAETAKVLVHVLHECEIERHYTPAHVDRAIKQRPSVVMDVWTGEVVKQA